MGREIGSPNRRADEFHHGDDYFQGYLWKTFGKEFSNPLDYQIGRSIPAKDWNYAHSSYPTKSGKVEPWKWRVHFALHQAPTADATLTIGLASADRARHQPPQRTEHALTCPVTNPQPELPSNVRRALAGDSLIFGACP